MNRNAVIHLDRRIFIEDALSRLTPRQRYVLELRWGLEEGQTPRSLADVADMLGVAKATVQSAERDALAKLWVIFGDRKQELVADLLPDLTGHAA